MVTFTKLNAEDQQCIRRIAEFWQLSTKQLVNRLMTKTDYQDTNLKWYLDACKRDVLKTACTTCGKLNTTYDDVGYFYSYAIVDGMRKFVARCETCHKPHTAER